MTLPRVLLHNDDTARLGEALRARFEQINWTACDSYEGLPACLAEFRPDVVYSVRFGGSTGFPTEALLGSDGPKWIANGGVGVDHLGSWDPAQVTVTNAAGVAADMMAEYVMGGFLHFTLDVPGLMSDKSNRVWRPRRVRPLKGQTLLIVGLGSTGQALAARAKAFGMTVIGTRARPQPMRDVDEVHGAEALTELLPRADCIAVATPLTAATRGILGAEAFMVMKPGVLIADVSRGGVIVQSALLEALDAGTLGGAVLDVFEVEPLPQDNPLWRAEKVLLSPHCSSVYDGWQSGSFDLFLQNLERLISGQSLLNVVDPQRGY